MLVCQLPTLQSGREPGEERGVPPSCSSPAGATPPPSAAAAGGHSGQRPRLLEPVGSLLPVREVSVTASLKFV